MRLSEKVNAQKTIDRLLDGEFGEMEVGNLFMRLREYAEGHDAFREIAHFVAHGRFRDRGDVHKFVDRFNLNIKYWKDYGLNKKVPNFFEPFPAYIVRHMIFQVDRCNSSELRQKSKISLNRLKKQIEKLFKINKQTEEAFPKRPIGPNMLSIFNHLLGFVHVDEPLFTADDLISDLLGVLNKNKLSFEKDTLLIQKPIIILCVMLIMHGIKFKFDEGNDGKCVIVACPLEAGEGSISEDFKTSTLRVCCAIEIQKENEDLFSPLFPILESGLLMKEFCDASLFSIEYSRLSWPNQGFRIFDCDLCLLEGSKKLGVLQA